MQTATMSAPDNDQYPRIYMYRRLVQAKHYIDLHFSETIDLDIIADEACFSKFHFIRLFSDVFGKTPHQYLITVRIANARKLLATGLPVQDTCFTVGFESVSSFTALFKKLTGITPSQFRQQSLKRSTAIREKPLQFIPHCFAQSNGWI